MVTEALGRVEGVSQGESHAEPEPPWAPRDHFLPVLWLRQWWSIRMALAIIRCGRHKDMRSACEPRAWPAYGKLGVKPPLNHVPRDEGSIKDRVKAASTQPTRCSKATRQQLEDREAAGD